MATVHNIKGTSVSSFQIGKGGVTLTADANGYITVADGAATQQPLGYNTIPIYEIDAADTFDLAHAGMMWHKDSGAAVTFTCDNDATIPQGSTWIVHNDDTEDLTIAQGSGVTIAFLASGAAAATGNVTVEQGGLVTVYKYTDTEYWVWGDDGPFNILTAGATTDSTLRWDGSVWAENTNVTATAAGVVTATSFNGVALTTAGAATNFLNETGAYSAPPAGTVTGTGTADQVSVWSGTSSQDSDSTFTWDGTTVIANRIQAGAGTMSANRALNVYTTAIQAVQVDSTNGNGVRIDVNATNGAIFHGIGMGYQIAGVDKAFSGWDEVDGQWRVGPNYVSAGWFDVNATAANFAGTLDVVGTTTAATFVADTTPIAETSGGTGTATYTTGDILYASGTNTLSKLGAGTDSYVLTAAGAGVVPTWSPAEPGGAALDAQYRFNTSTSEADPGNRFFRMNNATPASVTEIFVSATTDNSNDFNNILGVVSLGDQVYIQQDDDAAKFILLDVTANVDNTGWYSIAGTISSSGTIFSNNAKCHILILFGGTGGGAGTVTSVSAGDGLDFSTITGTGAVTMGTPGSLTSSTTNAVTGTSHTHAISLTPWTSGVDGDGFQLFDVGTISVRTAGGAAIRDEAASATNPTLVPDSTSSGTGIGANASGELSLIANSAEGMRFTRVSSSVLQMHEANIGQVADVSSIQGGGVITSSYNVYATVGTAGDCATLPAVAPIGTVVYVKNDASANSMDVFPASGDRIIPNSTNDADALAAGEGATYFCYTANSNWTKIADTGAPAASVAAANVSAGNLGSGVLPYVTALATSNAYKVPFLNITGNSSGNYGLQMENSNTFTYNPFTNILVAGTFDGNLDGTANVADNVAVADESTDATCFPLFVTTATGSGLPAKTGTNLTFDSITGDLGATTFNGVALSTATVQTTTATPGEILALAIASGTSVGFEAVVIGRQDATGDTVWEKITGMISNEAGTTAIIGSGSVDRNDMAGSTTWAITTAADDTSDELTFDVTGEASHTIDWKINLTVIEV